MKRKTILSIVLTSVTFFLNAQILFTENFTSTWAAATQGWVVINNSLPVGTTTVFQGNGATVFPAFNGAANDYVGMNFNSCSGAGGISTWLITPTLNISNGLVFEFATRTTSPIQFADRLQLRMSPVDNVAIPSGTTSVGTYTTLMLDINPNLGVNNSSVVVGNSVNGYPDAWAVYTVAVSGLAGPTIGRFALRYFVADGGPSGNESNYIGIDAVKISNPCNQPIINISQTSSGVCSGGTVNLSATSSGSNAATTFTWSSGQTGASTIVSPTITTTYTCTTTTNGVSCSSNYTITVNNSSASTNIVTAFDSFTWLDGNTYTESNNTATYTTTNAAGCDSVISLNLTITPSSPTLALQVFLDGYYTNGSNPAAMTAARYNNLVASGSATPGAATDVDVITVELRSPSNLDVVAYSVSPILQTNGSAQCVFPAGALGGSYYLVVKHRATNPLWSANPVTLWSSSAFSFANNSSNSYSDGSITPINTLVPSLFGIWLGELNDDGYLDGMDYPWYANETYLSAYGGLYLLDGDFDGDSYVDASDYAVFDYNSTRGSYEQRPY